MSAPCVDSNPTLVSQLNDFARELAKYLVGNQNRNLARLLLLSYVEMLTKTNLQGVLEFFSYFTPILDNSPLGRERLALFGMNKHFTFTKFFNAQLFPLVDIATTRHYHPNTKTNSTGTQTQSPSISELDNDSQISSTASSSQHPPNDAPQQAKSPYIYNPGSSISSDSSPDLVPVYTSSEYKDFLTKLLQFFHSWKVHSKTLTLDQIFKHLEALIQKESSDSLSYDSPVLLTQFFNQTKPNSQFSLLSHPFSHSAQPSLSQSAFLSKNSIPLSEYDKEFKRQLNEFMKSKAAQNDKSEPQNDKTDTSKSGGQSTAPSEPDPLKYLQKLYETSGSQSRLGKLVQTAAATRSVDISQFLQMSLHYNQTTDPFYPSSFVTADSVSTIQIESRPLLPHNNTNHAPSSLTPLVYPQSSSPHHIIQTLDPSPSHPQHYTKVNELIDGTENSSKHTPIATPSQSSSFLDHFPTLTSLFPNFTSNPQFNSLSTTIDPPTRSDKISQHLQDQQSAAKSFLPRFTSTLHLHNHTKLPQPNIQLPSHTFLDIFYRVPNWMSTNFLYNIHGNAFTTSQYDDMIATLTSLSLQGKWAFFTNFFNISTTLFQTFMTEVYQAYTLLFQDVLHTKQQINTTTHLLHAELSDLNEKRRALTEQHQIAESTEGISLSFIDNRINELLYEISKLPNESDLSSFFAPVKCQGCASEWSKMWTENAFLYKELLMLDMYYRYKTAYDHISFVMMTYPSDIATYPQQPSPFHLNSTFLSELNSSNTPYESSTTQQSPSWYWTQITTIMSQFNVHIHTCANPLFSIFTAPCPLISLTICPSSTSNRTTFEYDPSVVTSISPKSRSQNPLFEPENLNDAFAFFPSSMDVIPHKDKESNLDINQFLSSTSHDPSVLPQLHQPQDQNPTALNQFDVLTHSSPQPAETSQADALSTHLPKIIQLTRSKQTSFSFFHEYKKITSLFKLSLGLQSHFPTLYSFSQFQSIYQRSLDSKYVGSNEATERERDHDRDHDRDRDPRKPQIVASSSITQSKPSKLFQTNISLVVAELNKYLKVISPQLVLQQFLQTLSSSKHSNADSQSSHAHKSRVYGASKGSMHDVSRHDDFDRSDDTKSPYPSRRSHHPPLLFQEFSTILLLLHKFLQTQPYRTVSDHLVFTMLYLTFHRHFLKQYHSLNHSLYKITNAYPDHSGYNSLNYGFQSSSPTYKLSLSSKSNSRNLSASQFVAMVHAHLYHFSSTPSTLCDIHHLDSLRLPLSPISPRINETLPHPSTDSFSHPKLSTIAQLYHFLTTPLPPSQISLPTHQTPLNTISKELRTNIFLLILSWCPPIHPKLDPKITKAAFLELPPAQQRNLIHYTMSQPQNKRQLQVYYSNVVKFCLTLHTTQLPLFYIDFDALIRQFISVSSMFQAIRARFIDSRSPVNPAALQNPYIPLKIPYYSSNTKTIDELSVIPCTLFNNQEINSIGVDFFYHLLHLVAVWYYCCNLRATAKAQQSKRPSNELNNNNNNNKISLPSSSSFSSPSPSFQPQVIIDSVNLQYPDYPMGPTISEDSQPETDKTTHSSIDHTPSSFAQCNPNLANSHHIPNGKIISRPPIPPFVEFSHTITAIPSTLHFSNIFDFTRWNNPTKLISPAAMTKSCPSAVSASKPQSLAPIYQITHSAASLPPVPVECSNKAFFTPIDVEISLQETLSASPFPFDPMAESQSSIGPNTDQSALPHIIYAPFFTGDAISSLLSRPTHFSPSFNQLSPIPQSQFYSDSFSFAFYIQSNIAMFEDVERMRKNVIFSKYGYFNTSPSTYLHHQLLKHHLSKQSPQISSTIDKPTSFTPVPTPLSPQHSVPSLADHMRWSNIKQTTPFNPPALRSQRNNPGFTPSEYHLSGKPAIILASDDFSTPNDYLTYQKDMKKISTLQKLRQLAQKQAIKSKGEDQKNAMLDDQELQDQFLTDSEKSAYMYLDTDDWTMGDYLSSDFAPRVDAEAFSSRTSPDTEGAQTHRTEFFPIPSQFLYTSHPSFLSVYYTYFSHLDGVMTTDEERIEYKQLSLLIILLQYLLGLKSQQLSDVLTLFNQHMDLQQRSDTKSNGPGTVLDNTAALYLHHFHRPRAQTKPYQQTDTHAQFPSQPQPQPQLPASISQFTSPYTAADQTTLSTSDPFILHQIYPTTFHPATHNTAFLAWTTMMHNWAEPTSLEAALHDLAHPLSPHITPSKHPILSQNTLTNQYNHPFQPPFKLLAQLCHSSSQISKSESLDLVTSYYNVPGINSGLQKSLLVDLIESTLPQSKLAGSPLYNSFISPTPTSQNNLTKQQQSGPYGLNGPFTGLSGKTAFINDELREILYKQELMDRVNPGKIRFFSSDALPIVYIKWLLLGIQTESLNISQFFTTMIGSGKEGTLGYFEQVFTIHNSIKTWATEFISTLSSQLPNNKPVQHFRHQFDGIKMKFEQQFPDLQQESLTSCQSNTTKRAIYSDHALNTVLFSPSSTILITMIEMLYTASIAGHTEALTLYNPHAQSLFSPTTRIQMTTDATQINPLDGDTPQIANKRHIDTSLQLNISNLAAKYGVMNTCLLRNIVLYPLSSTSLLDHEGQQSLNGQHTPNELDQDALLEKVQLAQTIQFPLFTSNPDLIYGCHFDHFSVISPLCTGYPGYFKHLNTKPDSLLDQKKKPALSHFLSMRVQIPQLMALTDASFRPTPPLHHPQFYTDNFKFNCFEHHPLINDPATASHIVPFNLSTHNNRVINREYFNFLSLRRFYTALNQDMYQNGKKRRPIVQTDNFTLLYLNSQIRSANQSPYSVYSSLLSNSTSPSSTSTQRQIRHLTPLGNLAMDKYSNNLHFLNNPASLQTHPSHDSKSSTISGGRPPAVSLSRDSVSKLFTYSQSPSAPSMQRGYPYQASVEDVIMKLFTENDLFSQLASTRAHRVEKHNEDGLAHSEHLTTSHRFSPVALFLTLAQIFPHLKASISPPSIPTTSPVDPGCAFVQLDHISHNVDDYTRLPFISDPSLLKEIISGPFFIDQNDLFVECDIMLQRIAPSGSKSPEDSSTTTHLLLEHSIHQPNFSLTIDAVVALYLKKFK